jgi:cobalt/nickel transport system permease protein
VIAASAGFTLQYAIGGNGSASLETVAAAMVGVHTLIGIGEGFITALTVGAVLSVRPDLVHGARDLAVLPVLSTSGAV